MPKFRKKPVVIEAVQWDGTDEAFEQVKQLAGSTFVDRHRHVDDLGNRYQTLNIPTLEGDMDANIGDWIIRGVKGEVYPCKPDIFEQTYEEV